jgi:hypothetical protein
MSPALGKPLGELVQDLRERAWDAATGVRRAGRDADDIQEEISQRLHAAQGFRSTEAQRILDILDGRTPADTAPADHDCASRSNAGRRCMHLARNHPDLHKAFNPETSIFEEWK